MPGKELRMRVFPNAAPARSGWQLFPWILVAAVGFVVLVNIGMVTLAVRGFPGKVGRNGFDLSNQYNVIIEKADQAAKLGWVIEATLRESRPVVTVRDAAGRTLADASVTVLAQRPVGPPRPQGLVMRDAADGARIADTSLQVSGQWDLDITVEAAGALVRATRRVQVP